MSANIVPGRIGPGAPRKQKNVARYSIMDICRKSLFQNRLIFIIVTSSAEGAVQSEGLPFGQGKSMFALGLAVTLVMEYLKCGYDEAAEVVKRNIGYFEGDILDMLDRGDEERIPVWISDDMEVDFGKHRSHDNQCREIAYMMQTVRPNLAVFIATAPDLGQIAACWREIFTFEVKVPFRGYAEVQQIKRISNFYDPLDPEINLAYAGEQSYPMVSAELEEWYVAWRKRQVQKIRKRFREKYYDKKPVDPESIVIPKTPTENYHAEMGRKSGAVRRKKLERLKAYEASGIVIET